MDQTASRRDFIKTAIAAGTAPLILPSRVWAQAPSEQLNIAFIGTGGIAGRHIGDSAAAGANCPCYCDVDTGKMGKARQNWPDAKAYTDYREMLDVEKDRIDAVMVGTPDHHHYPATMLAMNLGKHVFTQKPLTHTPWEARQLLKAVQKVKVATQMGNQGHANEGNRIIYEYVRSGMLGEVRDVYAWTNRPVWPQGQDRPKGEDPVPESLNWDAWIGPAPMRPFKGAKNPKDRGPYHWFNWRGWWDFGGGSLADMACHTIDGMFWAMDPGHPTSVEMVASTPNNNDSFPDMSIVRWEFPARDWRPGFTLHWHDHGLNPTLPADLELDRKLPKTGSLFVGSEATLLVAGDYGNSPRIVPETKRQALGKPPKMLERSPGHMQEWVMACKGEKPHDYPGSSFYYAAPFSEVVLLGNVALRTGRRLEWDHQKMEFTNLPEANQFVSKTYRDGWDVRLA